MSDFDDDSDFDEDDPDEDDPDEDESEYPDEADVDQDDGDEYAETPPCPHCRKPLYEQAEVCPHCGKFISREETGRWRKPVWIVVGVIACLIVILIWSL
jgi:predicted nucleic acid-binding Zn ribbon protein